MVSVVKRWLGEKCTYKQQAVLLSALRGADGTPKEDISKKFTRELRSVLLNCADRGIGNDTFMRSTPNSKDLHIFCNNLDHYPVHWLMHFIHAVEIVGYKHPDMDIRVKYAIIYGLLCQGLHLNPESEVEMDKRLLDPDPEIERLTE